MVGAGYRSRLLGKVASIFKTGSTLKCYKALICL